MRVRLPHALSAALSFGLLTAAPAQAQAQDYEFVVIADSAHGYQPRQLGCPALNNAGQVAFRARTTDGKDQLLRGSGGDLTTIAGGPGRDRFTYIYSPSINSDGQVAFLGLRNDGTETIYRGNGARLHRIASTRVVYDDLSVAPSINDAGQVAFDAQFASTNAGLLYGKSPLVHRVYTFARSDFRGDGDAYSAPALGDGDIAFSALRRRQAPDGVYRQSFGGQLTTIAEENDSIYKFRGVTMNTAGEVAFIAFIEPGIQVIMVGSGGPLRTVVDTSGSFQDLGSSPPSINDAGTVAFTSSPDGFDSGLYIGPDPDADRVAGPGDVIAGSTVQDVTACGQALNDNGQLTFSAELTDGRAVIVRADPV